MDAAENTLTLAVPIQHALIVLLPSNVEGFVSPCSESEHAALPSFSSSKTQRSIFGSAASAG